jgi:hypothetical protein
MRLASAQKIRSIDFASGGIAGTGSLSPRARRTLAVYVVLVRMDFGGITAPMGAIADAIYRASHGEAGSVRTLQRANSELEERGYIRSANYRPGERAQGAVIYFNLEAFAYWTGRQTGPVIPLPTPSHNVVSRETMCDTAVHTTDCRGSEVTGNRSFLTPRDPGVKTTSQRAVARASNTTSPRRKRNAVLFSLGVVLAATGDLHRTDRRAARARARCEIDAIAAGLELVNPSGVDWPYWSKRWGDLAIEVRESTIRREILPMLLGRPTPPPPIREPLPSPELPELPTVPAPTAEEVRAARLALEERFSIPAEASPPPAAPAAAEYPEIDPTDPEMALLLAARERARARAVNG